MSGIVERREEQGNNTEEKENVGFFLWYVIKVENVMFWLQQIHSYTHQPMSSVYLFLAKYWNHSPHNITNPPPQRTQWYSSPINKI